MVKETLYPRLTAESNVPFNYSFMTKENMRWFKSIALNWLPNSKKPLVCLPCASGNKTRAKFGKKVISQCTSHQLLGPVTRDKRFEHVILSEPLTIIPYSLELHPSRPDYNLPVNVLSIQGEQIFINQLSLWLCRVKLAQPLRNFIYYIGSTHHYLILKYANLAANNPFHIVFKIPEKGMKDYGKAAHEFRETILKTEELGIVPDCPEPDIDKWLNSRSGYTTRVLWREIRWTQQILNSKIEGIEPVSSDQDYEKGFGILYQTTRQKQNENTDYLSMF